MAVITSFMCGNPEGGMGDSLILGNKPNWALWERSGLKEGDPFLLLLAGISLCRLLLTGKSWHRLPVAGQPTKKNLGTHFASSTVW